MKTKQSNAVSWILSGIVALIFVASAIFKLSGAEGTSEMAQHLGGRSNLIILGILELVSAALFLYTRTGIIGALLMVAYMGGAMAVHFVTGQSMAIVITTEILIWIASLVRFPELRERLFAMDKNF